VVREAGRPANGVVLSHRGPVRDHGVKGVETAVNLHERFPDGVVALPLDGRRQAGRHIGHNETCVDGEEPDGGVEVASVNCRCISSTRSRIPVSIVGSFVRYIPTVVNVVHDDSTGNPTAVFDPRREERDSCTSV
jgi:hypothetical protein